MAAVRRKSSPASVADTFKANNDSYRSVVATVSEGKCWDPFVAKMRPYLLKPILEIGQQFGSKVTQVFDQFHQRP